MTRASSYVSEVMNPPAFCRTHRMASRLRPAWDPGRRLWSRGCWHHICDLGQTALRLRSLASSRQRRIRHSQSVCRVAERQESKKVMGAVSPPSIAVHCARYTCKPKSLWQALGPSSGKRTPMLIKVKTKRARRNSVQE